MKNEAKPRRLHADHRLLDREGKTVQTAEATQEIAADGEYEFVQQVDGATSRKLWW